MDADPINYDALAGSIKAGDIASNEINANILRRIMNNDLENLGICAEGERGDEDSDYCPENAREMGWLGYFVGKSTRIKGFYVMGQLEESVHSILSPFFRGICANRSIQTVEMWSIEGGDIIRMMVPYFKQNPRITTFIAEECDFGDEGCRQLSLALGGCKGSSLTKATFTGCGINEVQFADIAVALSMHPKLQHLSLDRNSIGRQGFVALATLLQFSAHEVEYLDLDGNGLDDEAVEALVPALAHCKKMGLLDLSNHPTISVRGWRALAGLLEEPHCSLDRLVLHGNTIEDETIAALAPGLSKNKSLLTLNFGQSNRRCTITDRGCGAISKLLCDTSSINKTFLSNHTLQYIYPDVKAKPLLAMNKMEASKKEIAMIKILAHHEDVSMQPFFEWDFKVLPFAIDWFARAQSISALDDATRRSTIPARKLSAIYQFVRGMPLVYVESRLRSQLGEVRYKELKIEQERLMLKRQLQELEHRSREVTKSKESIMARLSG